MANQSTPAQNGEKKQKTLFRSAYGQPVAGSIRETDKFVEADIQQGPNFAQKVRAYKDDAKAALKAAIEQGGPVLVRGSLLGSKDRGNVHIAVNSVNEPMIAKGKVVRVSHSAPGKQPAVNGFILQEVEGRDGQTYKIGKPFRAFGDSAVALAGLQNNDFISGEAREVVAKREKDGDVSFVDAIEYVGAVSIGDAELRKEAETDNQLDEAAYQSNSTDFDDEIPF